MIKTNVLVPSSMLNYQCQMCGQCCKGWRVDLSKNCYDRLHKAMIQDHSEEYINDFMTIDKADDEVYYAHVLFKNDGNCGALDEDSLCSLHKQYGMETLGDTCKGYPRLVTLTPFGKELAITFSCPHAADLLRDKQKIFLQKNPENFYFDNGDAYQGIMGEKFFKTHPLNKFYFVIEEHLLEIIQTGLLSIDERLCLLGLTVKKLDELTEPQNNDIDDLIHLNQRLIMTSEFKDQIKSLKPAVNHQVLFLKEFVNYRLQSIKNQDLKDILMDVSKVLHFDKGDEQLNLSIDTYLQTYEQYYLPNKNELEHIYENFFVYFVLRKNFAKYGLRNAYFLTVYFYTLIRLMAIGLALIEEKPVDEDILIRSIWVIEKAIGHSFNFYKKIIDFMNANEMNSISHNLAMIKMPEREKSLATH